MGGQHKHMQPSEMMMTRLRPAAEAQIAFHQIYDPTATEFAARS